MSAPFLLGSRRWNYDTCSELFFAIDIFSGSGQFCASSATISSRARREGLQPSGSICSDAVLSDGWSANSLREICGGLATATGKLVHLGLRQAPTRATLAYANAHRPWQLYQTVFEEVLKSCQNLAATKKRRFRFKHPLRSVDTSIIELCI